MTGEHEVQQLLSDPFETADGQLVTAASVTPAGERGGREREGEGGREREREGEREEV